MSIQRIQQAGFAQVANGVLRDRRLSWKARGLLAFVLSHPDGFNAPRDWLERQSDNDGQFVVRSILKELDKYGYRRVTRKKDDRGRWVSATDWFQYPYGDPNFVYPENALIGGFPTGGSTHQ